MDSEPNIGNKLSQGKIHGGVLHPMLRSYRSIVCALGGLALASPSYAQRAKTDQPKAEGNPSRQLERIAAAIEKQPVASAPDGGCDPPKDDRKSDLCAQWKAADSATESARWTFWTLILTLGGLLLGGGTLFAAWRAAHWAKKAAEHTETGANEAKRGADATELAVGETRRIGEAQVRAYLSGAEVQIGYALNDVVMFKCVVKNSGQSPARGVQCIPSLTHFVIGHGIKRTSVPRTEEYPSYEIDISVGETDEIACSVSLPPDETERPAVQEAGKVLVTLELEIVGTDVFGAELRQLERFSRFFEGLPADNAWHKLKRDGRIR